MSLVDLMLFTPLGERYFKSNEQIKKCFDKEIVEERLKAWDELVLKLLNENGFTDEKCKKEVKY